MLNIRLSSEEFTKLSSYIQDHCGIALGIEKAYLLESRLTKLLIDSGLSSFEELYQRMYRQQDAKIAEQVIDAITTNETQWFRDKKSWMIIEQLLLPAYIEDLRAGRVERIRIWSAACSTGQEPYSIAMCIDNYLKQHGITDISLAHFEIMATDISRTVLEIAAMGRYDNISIMRGLDQSYRDKYFSNQGRVWVLDEKIKQAVTFRRFNLQNSFLPLGKFELVFCCYVIVYFSELFRREMVEKLGNCLKKQGVLLIGNSEILSDYRKYFYYRQHGEGWFYQIK